MNEQIKIKGDCSWVPEIMRGGGGGQLARDFLLTWSACYKSFRQMFVNTNVKINVYCTNDRDLR